MSSDPLKRTADPGVAGAVQSIVKNKKFKGMMMFGLKALCNFCVPPNLRYKENSMAAFEEDAVPILVEAVKNNKGDEDVQLNAGKTLWGISEALKDEKDSAKTAKFVQQGGPDAILEILGQGNLDEEVLVSCLDFVKNLADLGVQMDPTKLAAGVVAALDDKTKPKTAARILQAVATTASKPEGAAVLAKLGATEKVLKYCVAQKGSSAEVLQSVEHSLIIVKDLASQEKAKTEYLENTMVLLERYKDNQAVASKGSDAMAAMIGPDELKKCLSTLSKNDADADEFNNALSTLVSMSYIASYADAIVKAGGTPLLCNGISKAAEQLKKTKNAKVEKGISGACKMLSRIVSNPSNEIPPEGLKAVCDAFEIAKDDRLDAAAACCDCMAKFATTEKYAKEIQQKGIYTSVMECVKKNNKNAPLSTGAMALIAAGASHDSVVADLAKQGAAPVICAMMKNHPNDKDFLCNSMVALQHLSSQITSLDAMAEDLDDVAKICAKNAKDPTIAGAAIKLMEKLVLVAGDKHMRSGACSDAVMQIMMEHQDNAALAKSSQNILEVIATEKDVANTLQDLDKALQGTRTNPDKAFKSLAAVSGLASIPRLHKMFEAKDAASIVKKGVKGWVDGLKFNDQQKIIKAGLKAFNTLSTGGKDPKPTEGPISDLLELAQVPKMKMVVDKQDIHDNNLLDLLATATSLSAMKQISSEEAVSQILDHVLKIMRKYQDQRTTQIACMRFLTELASECNGAAAKKIAEEGAIKQVIAYALKVSMHEEVQIAAFDLMNRMVQQDPTVADGLKRSGALDLVGKANRAHGGKQSVRARVSQLMAVLVPQDALEREIRENLQALASAVVAKNDQQTLIALRNLNQYTTNAEGARIATRCEFGRIIAVAAARERERPKHDTAESTEIVAELAHVLKNVTQLRVGVVDVQTNGGGIVTINGLVSALETCPDGEVRSAGLQSALWSFRRLNDDVDNHAVCYKNKVHNKVLMMMLGVSDDDPLLADGAAAVASIKGQGIGKDADVDKFIARLVNIVNTSPNREAKLQAVKALEEFVVDPDDSIIEVLEKHKMPEAMMKIMKDYPDDRGLFKYAARALEKYSDSRNLRTRIMAMGGESALADFVKVQEKNLQVIKADPDDCAGCINLINKATNDSDIKLLQGGPLLDTVQELMVMHPDHQPLVKATGDLLAKIGADDMIQSLMRQIIDQENKKPVGWTKNVEKLANRLGLYVAAGVQDENKAFSLSKPCCDAMAAAANAEPANVGLLASVAEVTRRLGDRFWDDTMSPFGSRAMMGNKQGLDPNEIAIAPYYSRLLCDKSTNASIMKNKKFLCSAFRSLAAVAHNAEMRPQMIKLAKATGLVPAATELLAVNQNDADVVARITEFLAELAQDSEGADLVASNFTVNGRRIPPEDCVAEISAMMNRHRTNGAAVAAGMELLGNMGQNCKNSKPPPLAAPSETFMKELAKTAEQTPAGLAAFAVNSHRIVAATGDAALVSATMKSNVARLNRALDDANLSGADKCKLEQALAKLVEMSAEAGDLDMLKAAGGVDALINQLSASRTGDAATLAATTIASTRALMKVGEKDPDVSAKILRNACPVLLGSADLENVSDPAEVLATLHMLQAVAAHEGNGRILANNKQFKDYMAGVAAHAGEWGAEGQEILAAAANVNRIVDDDNPETLTLEQVHNKWNNRKLNGETLEMDHAAVILQQLDFVADYTEEYGTKDARVLSEFQGRELMFGSLCFNLLHEHETNMTHLQPKNEPQLWLKIFKRQDKDEELRQYPCMAAHSFCSHTDSANSFAMTEGATAGITAVIEAGRKGLSGAEKEVKLIVRLELAERTAINRSHYNGTALMAVLISIWDDFDEGQYSTVLLRHVFRTMRRIINDTWLEIILKNKVPKRLIEIVDKKNADLALLPDVLFLLGTLAVVPEIKTLIGELKGVEACLDLIKRCQKKTVEETAPVQTNACLALANITGGHQANIKRFTDGKGLELNIEVMKKSMAEGIFYDVANAASVLMCNLCFRRDDLKQAFGSRGAPTAVMTTIRKYDGSDSKPAFRCLGSMFKAIANLALFTPNVQQFLQNGVEQTFAHFYGNSEFLPDELLEVSLRTMSNLVMENTDEFMMQFGVVLEPLLSILKQGHRSSSNMFSLSFEILGNLSRLEQNAARFVSNEGIQTVLKILNSTNDTDLYGPGIYVLGIQTNTKSSVDILLDCGVFNFLVNVYESGADGTMSAERCTSALRCAKRILRGSQRATQEFVSVGGVAAAAKLAANAEESMVNLETYRVILGLLVLNPPPAAMAGGTAATVEDEFSGDVGIEVEEWTSRLEKIARPPSPRSWEKVGLYPEVISDLVRSICQETVQEKNESHLMLLKCGLGLMAYFATEKIVECQDAFVTGGIWKPLTQFLKKFEGDSDVSQIACHLALNVLYMCEEEILEGVRKDEDFVEFQAALANSAKLLGKKTPKKVAEFCRNVSSVVEQSEGTAEDLYADYALCCWDFPYEVTEWDKDPYPNGVQDLPQQMREHIRKGAKGKCMINNEKFDKENFFWKASQDMIMFQWRIDPKEGPAQHAIPVSRIRAIHRGPFTPTLAKAAERKKVTGGTCCGIVGPETEEFPAGVFINLLFATSRARNAFVDMLAEWREAATYGF